MHTGVISRLTHVARRQPKAILPELCPQLRLASLVEIGVERRVVVHLHLAIGLV